MNCKRCRVPMVSGKALENTFVGVPDFPDESQIYSLHYGGPGKLIECLKCPECGYSVTPCKCSMRTKLLGDGCAICNPEYYARMMTDE